MANVARGGADAPAFIFGKRNLAYKPQGEDQTRAESRGANSERMQSALKDSRAAFEAKHGRAPNPDELQDAFRKKLMKQVRGRTLVALMRKNGGKPPSQEEFKAAVKQWTENHLDDAMAAVNKELGTEGSGIEEGEFAGDQDTRKERRQGRRNFREATREATDFLQRARKALAETPPEALQAWYGKAETVDSPEANEARQKRLEYALREFFKRQHAAVVTAVRQHGEHVARKPKDTDIWWSKKWDAELEAILKPYEQKLAAETYAKVAAELGGKGLVASKATLTEVLPELTSNLGKRITGINETTRESVYKQIEEGIRYGEGGAQIADRLEDAGIFGEYRSELVARTETAHALNDAAIGSYSEYGVTQVEAVDGDEDEACANRNGKVFSIDEARGIQDHPNGTLSWSPVIVRTVEQIAPKAEREVVEKVVEKQAKTLADMDFEDILKGIKNNEFDRESVLRQRYGVKVTFENPASSLYDVRHTDKAIRALEDMRKVGAKPKLREIVFDTRNPADVRIDKAGNVAAQYENQEELIRIFSRTADYRGNYGGYREYGGRALRTQIDVDDFHAALTHELGHAVEYRYGYKIQSLWDRIIHGKNIGDQAQTLKILGKELKFAKDQAAHYKRLAANADEIGDGVGYDRWRLAAEAAEKEQLRITQLRKDLRALSKEDAEAIEARMTSYANINGREDFAESFWFYVHDPETLKRRAPRRYRWIKDLLEGD